MKKKSSVYTNIFKFILWLLVGLIFLALIFIGRSLSDFKLFYSHTAAAKTELESSLQALASQDLPLAQSLAVSAEENFSLALASLDSARDNLLTKNYSLINRQIDELVYLDKAGLALSRSLSKVLQVAKPFAPLLANNQKERFADLSAPEKAAVLAAVYQAGPEIIALRSDIDEAVDNLESIHRFGVLYPVYSDIEKIKEKARMAQEILDVVSPWLGLSPTLAGYPESSRFLLLLQNNDELRPTGGFLGTFGVLEIAGGEIKKLVTKDTYHLDMPTKDKLNTVPPAPLRTYLKVDKLFLRDSNWSPDWPTAARDIQFVYDKEMEILGYDNPGFTGVFAITPDLISDLIAMTGPITVKGETYNKDNFQKLLQYNVEIAYREDNISSWDRKEVINDIIAELQLRLEHLPLSKAQELAKLIGKNLAEKNILLYLNDPQKQSQISGQPWSGELTKTDSDYLMVVDANLGAFKSDAVMIKDIKYELEGRDKYKVKLSLSYRHTGGFDWRTTRYRSYSRVYVPRGAILNRIWGNEEDTLNVYDDPALDKTVFAFFMVVEPGQAKTIELEYELPERIAESGQYSLLVQKQPGRRTNSLSVDLDLAEGLRKFNSSLLIDRVFSFSE